jgi:hypothetical protein
VDERLKFIRADGATTMVDRRDAHVIAEALWDLGLLAGAATAAASIAAAMKTNPYLQQPVRFTEREDEALRRASDGCVSWSAPDAA